ncbi:MAG: 2-oxoacid:ferredoxin oxidoreductase subunit beta [Betaproteobacteria bacterium]|nr:2-oxoacid:ferredoxin oxidoreductase subunit beta [Betaproteobacteria bacterium]
MGIGQAAVANAIESLALNPRQVAYASGSGCYTVMGEQLGLSGYHGPHGRAVAVAMGMKMARPELTVLTLQGDGDALAIGASHFIHAARRNIDITVVVFNNFGYSETGGQYGPTTPKGAITETSPYGCPENPFDIYDLARGAGATYIARSTSFHPVMTARLIADGIQHKGFAVIEVLINCHVLYGKRNGTPDAVSMLELFRDNSVPVTTAANMKPEELKGKWIIGEIYKDTSRPEFCAEYYDLIRRVQQDNQQAREPRHA